MFYQLFYNHSQPPFYLKGDVIAFSLHPVEGKGFQMYYEGSPMLTRPAGRALDGDAERETEVFFPTIDDARWWLTCFYEGLETWDEAQGWQFIGFKFAEDDYPIVDTLEVYSLKEQIERNGLQLFFETYPLLLSGLQFVDVALDADDNEVLAVFEGYAIKGVQFDAKRQVKFVWVGNQVLSWADETETWPIECLLNQYCGETERTEIF
jgi:hypothetical protein